MTALIGRLYDALNIRFLKKLLIAVAVVMLAVFIVMLAVWRMYCNRVWVPLVEISKAKGAVQCGQIGSSEYTADVNGYTLYLCVPGRLSYSSTITVQDNAEYDPDIKEVQYITRVTIVPQRDGSFTYYAGFNEIRDSSEYGRGNIQFDPDTFEFIEEENLDKLTNEEREYLETAKKLFKEKLSTVKSLTKTARDFWEI